jgi:hypothetical protein
MRPNRFAIIVTILLTGFSQAFEDKPSNNERKLEGTKWTNVEATVNGLKIPRSQRQLRSSLQGV